MQKDTKKGKLLGAAASALVIAVPVLVLAGLVLYAILSLLGGGYRLGAGILLLYAIPLLAVAVGVFLALRQRWKEVKGGEEDEARKY